MISSSSLLLSQHSKVPMFACVVLKSRDPRLADFFLLVLPRSLSLLVSGLKMTSIHSKTDDLSLADEAQTTTMPAAAPPPPPPLISKSQYRRYKLAYSAVQFASGIAFAPFITYVPFQLQFIAFFIDHEPGMPVGTGCSPMATSCRVPFANGGDVNLTSFINYINAIAYAVSGVLTLIISGIGDRLSFQREQFIFFLVGYGAFCLPFAALTGYALRTFNIFAALYVVFNIFGFLCQAWGKVFIPFLMYAAEDASPEVVVAQPHQPDQAPVDEDTDQVKRDKREAAGLSMSLWGYNALNGSQIIITIIAIGVTYASATNAGLYLTTAGGVICILLALIAGPFLPAPRRQRAQYESHTFAWIITTPLQTFADLFIGLRRYPEAFKVLLAYTIYTDTTFAFGSVTGQLFNLNVRPSIREFSAYSIVGPATSILVSSTLVWTFPVLQRRLNLTLRWWTVVAYSLNLFVAVWACIGISEASQVGFKHRWEFYLTSVIQNAGGAIANLVFSVPLRPALPARARNRVLWLPARALLQHRLDSSDRQRPHRRRDKQPPPSRCHQRSDVPHRHRPRRLHR
ncbi:hypothetical protein V8E36_007251 [Tilletia maclaganii]